MRCNNTTKQHLLAAHGCWDLVIANRVFATSYEDSSNDVETYTKRIWVTKSKGGHDFEGHCCAIRLNKVCDLNQLICRSLPVGYVYAVG